MTLASSCVYLGMTCSVKKYGKVETSLFGTEAFYLALYRPTSPPCFQRRVRRCFNRGRVVNLNLHHHLTS